MSNHGKDGIVGKGSSSRAAYYLKERLFDRPDSRFRTSGSSLDFLPEAGQNQHPTHAIPGVWIEPPEAYFAADYAWAWDSVRSRQLRLPQVWAYFGSQSVAARISRLR